MTKLELADLIKERNRLRDLYTECRTAEEYNNLHVRVVQMTNKINEYQQNQTVTNSQAA